MDLFGYIVADSTGATGEALTDALCAQFPALSFQTRVIPECRTTEALDEALDCILSLENARETVLVFNSIIVRDLSAYLADRCEALGLRHIELFTPLVHEMELALGHDAVYLPGLTRSITPEYLNKISSIEFAVRFDDGKNPRGLEWADIVLIGISRTSKTPLSVYLANKGYNVANLPLVPEIPLPPEIKRVDPRRMIGLIISPERLKRIRNGRIEQMGADFASGALAEYADLDRIETELNYARGVFEQFGCEVFDVTDQTIEESAALIVNQVHGIFGPDVRRYANPEL